MKVIAYIDLLTIFLKIVRIIISTMVVVMKYMIQDITLSLSL